MRSQDLPLLDARLLFEKVQKAINRWPAGTKKGGQFAPAAAGGGASGDLFAPPAHSSSVVGPHGVLPKGAAFHPQKDDHGNSVVVHAPTPASAPSTWTHAGKTATFTPGGKAPESLNGTKLEPWHDAPTDHAGWKRVEGTNPAIERDAPFLPHPNKYTAAGVVIEEPDGRVWLTKPTNHFGGYQHTFPKGTAEPGLTLQQNAIKEAYEETGLQVHITGVLGDYDRDTSRARVFTAKRVGGTPSAMGWETQAMRLVPREQLHDFLNKAVDQGIASDYQWETPHPAHVQKSANQPRWPKGSPLGGQWKSAGSDGLTAPPKIGSATNPTYQKIADGMHKAAAAGDWKHVQASVDKLGEKVAGHATKGKLNSHDKWAAQAHQYGQELLAQKEHKAKATASAEAINGPDKLSSWKKVGAKPGGSSAGAMYEDQHGQKWLVKSYGDDNMAKSEVLASHLLKAAGAPAAEMKLVDLEGAHKGGLGVASKMLSGHESFDVSNAAHLKAAQGDFAAHAWLANWDAVGLSHDNLVMHGGKAVNIDPGGALDYKAMGGKKGKLFGTEVGELDSMRDASVNPSAKKVYGPMTHSEMQASAQHVLAVPADTISKLVHTYGPGDATAKAALTAKLLARQADIKAKLGGSIKQHTQHSLPELDGVVSKMPQGLSAANGGGVAHMILGHYKAGNLTALQNVKANLFTPSAISGKVLYDGKSKKQMGEFLDAAIGKLGGGAQAPAEAHHAPKAEETSPQGAPKAGGIEKPKFHEGSASGKHYNDLALAMQTAHAEADAEGLAHIGTQFPHNTVYGKKLSAYHAQLTADLAASEPKHADAPAAPELPTKPKLSDEFASHLADQAGAHYAKGGLADLADLSAKINPTLHAADSEPMKLKGYIDALHDHLKANGGKPAAMPKAARPPKAAPHVEQATAHAAAAKAPIALPAKPTKLSSAANPNVGLIKKVDAMHAHAEAYASGQISKDVAAAAIASHTFGTNTFGKTASKHQADLLAAIGSSAQEHVAQQVKAHADAVQAHAAAAKPAKKAPKFDPAKLSEPPNFLSWGTTGKSGPSGNEAVNQANHYASQAILEAAKSGKPEAIDALKLPLVNKHTGEKTEVSPMDHPSQWVKSFAQQMKNEIDTQLNPPKQFRLSGSNPIHALHDAHPVLKSPQLGAHAEKIGGMVVLGNPGHFDTAALKLPHLTAKSGKVTTATYAKAAQDAFSKMPAAQQAAVKAYTGSGYHEINGSLWKGNPDGQAKAAAEALHTLGHEIAPGTVLSRKISAYDGNGLKEILKAQGKIIQEPGIMSTSILPTAWHGNIQFKMTVGPGVKGLYVDEGSHPNGGAISKNAGQNEREVILPPDTRFLVQKVEVASKADKDGFGQGEVQHIVHVLVLPTQSSGHGHQG